MAGLLLAPSFYRSVAGLRIPAPQFSALIAIALGFAALAEAFGMSGRGAVELVAVSIAQQAGLFDQPNELVANLFSALVITAVVTTIAMPIALRADRPGCPTFADLGGLTDCVAHRLLKPCKPPFCRH